MKIQKYKTFVRSFIITRMLYDFIFAYAVYAVFFSIEGMSELQISFLLTWWCVTSVILEVPSGSLADYWSRKKLLIIAPIIKSLCFLSWFLADGNFYIFALGFLFWTIGSTMVSGTSDALLYDNLIEFNKKDEYEKISGKQNFYNHIGTAVSVVLGGFMASWNMDFTMLFSIIPLILCAIFACFLHEAKKQKSTEEIKYLQHIKIAYKEIKNNKKLLVSLLFLLGISIFGNLDEFDQLYYQLVHLPIWAFGLVGFIWSGLNALGSHYAYKFKNHRKFYLIIPIISALLLFFVGLTPSIWMIVFLMIIYLITTPLKILLGSDIQHNIKSTSRATTISVVYLLINLMGALLFPVYGLLGKQYGINTIYWVGGVSLIIFCIWIINVRKYFGTKKAIKNWFQKEFTPNPSSF